MSCGVSTMSLYRYIETQLFQPPRPLLHYPYGLAKDEDCHVSELCLRIYEQTGVPSVCHLHPNPLYTVVYSHGNAESLNTLGWYLREVSSLLQANVFAYEYEGYFVDHRRSQTPQPTEAACFSSAEKFLDAIKDVSPYPIVLLGYSMGAAVTLHAAQVHKQHKMPHAVVLLAPFVSAASTVLARRSFMVSLSPLWSWPDVFVMRTAALEQGHATFIAHGSNDNVIPVAHGQAIARWVDKHSKRCKFVEIPEADHASIRLFKDLYQDLSAFLESLGSSRLTAEVTEV